MMRKPLQISIDDQMKCVQREIAMRERVYPKRVAEGRLSQNAADYQLAAMKAVLETLRNASSQEVRKAELLLFGEADTVQKNATGYGQD